MSFTGDLKHLPIVDVIQLLHATKKSGTLTVKGRCGECIFVFSQGCIVSGRHARKSMHLGQILVELKYLAAEVLNDVLQQQAKGDKPLAALFSEGGHAKKEEIIRGLETLIEMAIVEVLTWSGGTFTLEVDRVELFADYAYFQQQDIVFGTQNVLMDALRIYDEKTRDGELTEEDAAEEAILPPIQPADCETTSSWTVSADDLGLSNLDQLEKKIPGVFNSLPDINPLDLHRQKLREIAPELSMTEQESLIAFLQQMTERVLADTAGAGEGGRGRVILFSPDELFPYMLTVACKDAGVFIFSTNDEQDLVPIIEQSLGKDNGTLLVLDRPNLASPSFSEENLVRLRRQLKGNYARLPVIQIAHPSDFLFSMQAFSDGIRTVFPRPTRVDRPESFTTEFPLFLSSFRKHLQGFARAQGDKSLGRLTRCLADMHKATDAAEAALTVLRYVATFFPRALTLVVGAAELVADKGIGIGSAAGAEAKVSLRIPLMKESLFGRVIAEGRLFYGFAEDKTVQEQLLPAISAPLHSTCLVLPLVSRGRTLALIYADFGTKEVAQVETELLDVLSGYAGLLMENLLLRKKLENSPR